MDPMQPPDVHDIRSVAEAIAPFVTRTPTLRWVDGSFSRASGVEEPLLKLEFLQRTGSFKVRGALANLLALDDEARSRGVVAVSAGNHAIAVAYAAATLGSHAKVVMPRTSSPARVAKAERYGAEVILVDDLRGAFEATLAIRDDEGRALVHPFEGRTTVTGQATLGLELLEQADDVDAVVVAVGGGGLVAGVGSAVRALRPGCRVIGVEPAGAPGLTRSLEAGHPLARVEVDTIADSMGAPRHEPETFAICQRVVDRMVLVDDDELRVAMAWAFEELKLALEPAGAASLAAVLGPLRGELRGQRVALIVCGSNLDLDTYLRDVRRGVELRADAARAPDAAG